MPRVYLCRFQVLYVACVTLIPPLFACVPVDCNALNDSAATSSSSSSNDVGLPPVTTAAIHVVDVCARVGQSSIEVRAGLSLFLLDRLFLSIHTYGQSLIFSNTLLVVER